MEDCQEELCPFDVREENRTGRQEAEMQAAGLRRPSSLLHIFKTVWRDSFGIVPNVLKDFLLQFEFYITSSYPAKT